MGNSTDVFWLRSSRMDFLSSWSENLKKGEHESIEESSSQISGLAQGNR